MPTTEEAGNKEKLRERGLEAGIEKCRRMKGSFETSKLKARVGPKTQKPKSTEEQPKSKEAKPKVEAHFSEKPKSKESKEKAQCEEKLCNT